jgi:hypothetical protein
VFVYIFPALMSFMLRSGLLPLKSIAYNIQIWQDPLLCCYFRSSHWIIFRVCNIFTAVLDTEL